MLSKDEIVKAILRVTGGDENKEFTKTAIAHELGRTKSTSSIDKIIKELESEGFIKFKEKRGPGIYYVLAKKQVVEEKNAEELYQIVTPIQINMSPEDPWGNKGHLAKALIGVEMTDPRDPIEAYHIVRSQDSCLVCTVH